jgi:hypothetical protein
MSSSISKAPSWLKILLTAVDAERGANENIVVNSYSNFDLTLVTFGISNFLAVYPSYPSVLIDRINLPNFHVP